MTFGLKFAKHYKMENRPKISVIIEVKMLSCEYINVVNSNKILGEVFIESKEKSGTLHFEIWEESKKINPISWLKN